MFDRRVLNFNGYSLEVFGFEAKFTMSCQTLAMTTYKEQTQLKAPSEISENQLTNIAITTHKRKRWIHKAKLGIHKGESKRASEVSNAPVVPL